MTSKLRTLLSTLLIGAAVWTASAHAADKLRVASSQRGFWDTTLVLWGQEQGFFKAENIDLDVLWTEGGADEVQAAVSGSVDITMNTGLVGVIGAWSKGAPVEIIGASMTGPSDLYWYVKSDSPIKTLADLKGKSISFSRPGSSTHTVALALAKLSGTDVKAVSTGGPASTLTQVMTNQVDVGWSAGAVNYDKVTSGELRLLARGSDAPDLKTQTIRVHIANKAFVEKNPDVAKRFLRAMQKTIDWAYKEDKAVQRYAEMNSVSVDVARKARDQFYPREALQMREIRGLDQSMVQAVESKRIDAPLSAQRSADMVKLVRQIAP